MYVATCAGALLPMLLTGSPFRLAMRLHSGLGGLTQGIALYDKIPPIPDAVDGPLPVTCSVQPGATLPQLGDTGVSCTSQDTSGNTASCSFTITVRARGRGSVRPQLSTCAMPACPWLHMC